MEHILAKLLDPSIWIVGLFVGLAARFIGQYLETRWDLFLGWSKARREQLKSEKESIIQAWSQDQDLVTLALLRALESTVVMFGILITDMLVILYVRTTYGEGDKMAAFFIVVVFIMTVFLFLFMRISMSQLSIAIDCFREFRKSRGLPVPGK